MTNHESVSGISGHPAQLRIQSRLRLHVLLIALALPALPTPAMASKLNWSWTAGDVFHVAETTVQEQSIQVTAAGAERKPLTDTKKSSRTTWLKYEVLGVSESRVIVIRTTLLGIVDAEGKPTEHSRRLKGSQFEFAYGPQGNVSEFSGYEAFIERASERNQHYARLLSAIYSRQVLENSMTQFIQVLPRGAEQEETGWQRTTNFDMGPFGRFDLSWNYRLDDNKSTDMQAVFSAEGTGRHRLDPESARGLPFRVVSGQLDISGLSGTGVFDHETGRLERLETAVEVSGQLSIEVGDDRADVHVQQKQKSSVRIGVEPPDLP